MDRPSQEQVEGALARLREGDSSALLQLFRLTRDEAALLLFLLVDPKQLASSTFEVYRLLLDDLGEDSGRAEASMDERLQRLSIQIARRHPDRSKPETPEDDAGRLRLALRSLADKQRLVFVLREVAGLSPERIAQLTGITLGTVHARLRRARLQMAEAMREPQSGGSAMKLHDTSTLWGLADSELEPGDAALANSHLEDCPECRDELSLIRTVCASATSAAASGPRLDWTPVEEKLEELLARRAARAAGLSRGRRWALVPLAAAVVLSITFGAWAAMPPPPSAQIPAVVQPAAIAPQLPQAPPPAPPAVLAAKDAIRATDGSPLAQGALLTQGDSIRTGRRGQATLGLSEAGQLRLGSETQLKLARLSLDGAAISLERGRAAMQASAPIEIAAGGFAARGANAVFSAALTRDGFEVAVARGRVHVRRPNALPMIVDAGHRAVFSTRSQQATIAILGAQSQGALAELLALPAPAPSRRPAVDPADFDSDWSPLPGAPAPARPPIPVAAAPVAPALPGPAPVAVAPLPQAPAVQTAPASAEMVAMQEALDAKPDLVMRAGSLIAEPQPPPREIWEAEKAARAEESARAAAPPPPAVQAPVPAAVAPAQQEWASAPAPAPAPASVPPRADAAVETEPSDDSGDDAEDLYLLRAERALKRGGCQRFLAGLEEIAGDTPATVRTERARIVRARCYEKLGRAAQAQAEYSRYLRDSPRGDFAPEAERHVTALSLRPRDSRLSDN